MLTSVLALARPGGEHGELFGILFYLALEQPLVGAAVLVLGVLAYVGALHSGGRDWDTGTGGLGVGFGEPGSMADIRALAAIDPEFSTIAFEALVRRSYIRAHRLRDRPDELETMTPRLEPGVREQLVARGGPVLEVLVASVHAVRVGVGGPQTAEIEVELSARITTASTPEYLRERWTFRRLANASWRISAARILSAAPEPTGMFDEVAIDTGVRLPTVFDPELPSAWKQLAIDDPEISSGNLESRVHTIFRELNRARAEGRVGPARAYLSEGVVDWLRYWSLAASEAQLEHRFEDARVSAMRLVRVARDPGYDVLTYRVALIGRESWVRADDASVVRGDPWRERSRSEYWTLIRKASTRGRAHDDGGCPCCGAPLRVSSAGFCVHCGAQLGVGECDWVLGRIDSDEVYAG